MQPVSDDKQRTSLKIEGYKSIKACDLKLGALNVLIGANGAADTPRPIGRGFLDRSKNLPASSRLP